MKPVGSLPAQPSTTNAAGGTMAVMLAGQPLISVQHAVETLLLEKGRKFRPTPGELFHAANEYTEGMRLQLAHLKEAISGATN